MSHKEFENIKADISLADDFESPREIPLMPLRNTVLYPQQVIPLYIGRERSLRLLDELLPETKLIAVVAQKDISTENPKEDDLYSWGTLAQVLKIFDMPDKSKSAIVQGIERIQILKITQESPFYKAVVRRVHEVSYTNDVKTQALVSNLYNQFQTLVDKAQYLTNEHLDVVKVIRDPGRLADKIVSILNVQVSEKQSILEIPDVQKRLTSATILVNKEIQRMEVGEKIQSQVQDSINKNQREYFLREQLKAIRKELGEDDTGMDTKELEEKIEKSNLPEEVLKVARKELTRLERISPQSPEYTVSRTYLEWLVELPWSVSTDDQVDITKAEQILNEDHYGLEKIKERILEYLAVRKLKQQKDPKAGVKGPILCFIGPPGVGKTSVGMSIARAMGRKFYRMSLGGVRDEAEIRGHRRTYIGALPGRIIQGIKKAGSNNPVFMLDEIDKLGADFRGDPSSALLEVLDPEQNYSFSDHYLEVPFDLRHVMFIATANWYDPIPDPLKDRMEILEFPGYTEPEKIHIAKSFLIPKQIKEHGLEQEDIIFTNDGISTIIENFTRESGVRNLEREIANICRKVAREKVEKGTRKRRITSSMVTRYLGKKKYYSEVAERMVKPGIAVGLAWTAVGGDILFIEATKMPGTGKLILTGKLGDVMQESAQAAMSFIRANAERFGIDPNFNKEYDVHVHIPAGAIPKDGPSAGVTLMTAMVSVLSDRMVKDRFAMTGEITLRGHILPVGGIKEKVIAANRAGIRNIILPDKNKKDIDEDIPAEVKKEMTFHFLDDMLDVLDLALEPKKDLEKK
ncbi:TPA: endopeptidase La [Candidatus Marinimicrobia bacterium]|nr:MAG: Lon protease [Marinimicrobia bacterium 46_47]KUK93124.1 MAG: Lon protease [Marinimicrobia bacterium 46_43]HAE86435.1 endopeptidase La [Candidatus Neomarinimicrobiota bacterium]HBY19071.1 endopeptidase La [Candidatus Neomarinimicrobiota bacterium]